jgi:hypothetical protein
MKLLPCEEVPFENLSGPVSASHEGVQTQGKMYLNMTQHPRNPAHGLCAVTAS